MLMQQEYRVMSQFPSGVRTAPRGMATVSSRWKNWLTLLSSLFSQTELRLQNAVRTYREAGDQSPGKPIAPIPWPKVGSSRAGSRVLSG